MPFRSVYLLSLLVVLMFGVSAQAQDDKFAAWVEHFRLKARAQGISSQTLDDAFIGVEPDETVVRLDRKQPENKITLTRYLNNVINERRIAKGREMMREHADELAQISKHYGVQAKYIVALWAIESDFGDHQGNFSVVQSLATLAYEGRRAKFFADELIAALRIMENEHLRSDELTGSWAGAMGGCQFMPSTYLKYAVDGNGDGKRDIWETPSDVFASVANYLHGLGWDPNVDTMEPEVLDSGNFKKSEASIEHAQTAEYFGTRGFAVASGQGNGQAVKLGGPRKLYAIYLSKGDEEENNVSLVSENFKALLNWNRSRYFATAVSQLADAIEEK